MNGNIKKVVQMFSYKLSKDITVKCDYSSGVYKYLSSAQGSVVNMIEHIGDETVEELFSRLFIPGINGDIDVLRKSNTLQYGSKEENIKNALELFMYCCERGWLEIGILLANKVLLESNIGMLSVGYLNSSEIRRIILDKNYDFLLNNCIFCKFNNDNVTFRYKVSGSGLDGIYAYESVSYDLMGIISDACLGSVK